LCKKIAKSFVKLSRNAGVSLSVLCEGESQQAIFRALRGDLVSFLNRFGNGSLRTKSGSNQQSTFSNQRSAQAISK
jgi:hypothetical protein